MSDTAPAPASHPEQTEQAEHPAPSPVTELNARTARRQKLLMGAIGALVLIGGSWFILGGDEKTGSEDPDAAQTIDTAGIVNRDLANREFVATYSNRIDAVTREQKALRDASVPRSEIEEQLAALKAENQAMRMDGQAAIDAISAENAELRTRLASQPPAPAAPPPTYGPQAGGYDARGTAAATTRSANTTTENSGPAFAPGEVKLMSFASEKAAPVGPRTARPETPPVVVEDSPDYLPPNSYAPARVIVGVDASAGVSSQTDPLPVVLRITGPARSVMQNGKVLTTRIEGCIVNGAARGDLSSEKVYVKLARMTCDQPGGRVAVSEVKGFISFAGKSGVRGRVVSREGNLVSQALLAGIVGGFGRGFSANANGIFAGQVGTGQQRQQLSATDILAGGLGQGAGEAADTVSRYLIERAEQYQPVVEMPTGIAVEIVFLDGVFVRNSQ
jgi:conjugal transfer pilus assembly protein TraB